MHDKEDFFSPDMVDERLELSLLQHDAAASGQDAPGTEPDLLLIADLRYLYGSEGTEHVRSLQRVWENLREQHAKKSVAPARSSVEVTPERHLRLLKPSEGERVQEVRRKSRRVPGRSFAALAAVLFLVLMVGSLLMIVHLTRAMPSNGSQQATTPPDPTSLTQPTSIPHYPYAPPGRDIAVSPASSEAFYALAWSPGGKQLATSTEGKIWIW